MKKFMTVILAGLTAIALSGCSSNKESNAAYDGITLTPAPPDPIDPPDYMVDMAVSDFLKEVKAPAFSKYEFNRVDLNNDTRRDALILFKNPYGFWCGTHGCTMLVFKAHDRGFTLVNGIQPVREPLYVSETESNGWKNIITRVSGRWHDAKDVSIQFNGEKYPENPSSLPEYMRYASNNETRLFYD